MLCLRITWRTYVGHLFSDSYHFPQQPNLIQAILKLPNCYAIVNSWSFFGNIKVKICFHVFLLALRFDNYFQRCRLLAGAFPSSHTSGSIADRTPTFMNQFMDLFREGFLQPHRCFMLRLCINWIEWQIELGHCCVVFCISSVLNVTSQTYIWRLKLKHRMSNS